MSTPRPAVPGRLMTRGPKPRGTKACGVCRLRYEDHTGNLCVICGHPADHHQDADRMEAEIRGAAHLALAREAGGYEVREWERWCIRWVEDHPVATDELVSA